MTNEDRKNLDFILNTDEDTLDEWKKSLSVEELQYAASLLSIAILEEFDQVQDTEAAKLILSRYM